MDCEKIACFLKTGNDKDLNQFLIWVSVNELQYEIFDDPNEFPIGAYRVDFESYFKNKGDPDIIAQHPNLISEFYKYLENKMVVQCGSDGYNFPHAIFDKNIQSGVEWLLEKDVYECLPNSFVPGPGFGWLYTNNYKREHYQLYGENTTRDYIDDMYCKKFINSIYHPELHANKNSKDFKIVYNVGCSPVGFIPPRARTIVKNNYPWQVDLPDYNIEAKLFFSKEDQVRHLIGDFKMPLVCLQSEYTSIARFCPDVKLTTGYTKSDKQIFLTAYNYVKQDWKFETNSVSLLSEADVCSNRTWNNSPGYPYNKHGCTTARQAFDEFYGLLTYYDKMAGYDWMPTIFNVFCKDELLRAEKVDANDIRTIIAPSLCQQLMGQKLTLNVSMQVSSNWRSSHTSIGRTRYFGHVNATGSRIGRFPIINEYDISKWDRSVKALLLKIFWMYLWDIINTNDIHDFWKLANVFESTIYSHMSHRSGEVIRKAYGVPSGFTLTSYANSWIHTFINILSFCELFPYGTDPIVYFKENCDFVCYGDDGLMGMSEDCAKWYTIDKRAKWLKERFGMELRPDKCKIARSFTHTVDRDVDGIVFLGDVLSYSHEYKEIVPIFKISKVVNQLIFGCTKRVFTPGEMILLCYTHYVECFFHPWASVIYRYLKFLLNKYKLVHVSLSSSDVEILNYMMMNANDLINAIRNVINDENALRNLIYTKLYSSDESETKVSAIEFSSSLTCDIPETRAFTNKSAI